MNKLLEQENTLLRKLAEPIHSSEFDTPWLKKLIDEMLTILHEKGAVGIAAPQIGVSKRVIIFGTNSTKNRKIEHEIPDTVLINPMFKILTDEIQIGYEGCLNCGEQMAEVPRASNIEYTGLNLKGEIITKQASGLEARIIQHEVDHLNGILFIDKVINHASFTTLTEFRNRQKPV